MKKLIVVLMCIAMLGCKESLSVPEVMSYEEIQQQLAEAQRKEDLAEVIRLANEAVRLLSSQAGVPEVPDEIEPVPDAEILSAAEADTLFLPILYGIPRIKWWRVGLDPTRTEHLPREVASVMMGCIAAHRANLKGEAEALAEAKAGGDYLIWSQQQGGTGVIPFPALRNGKNAAFQAAERQFRRAEREGRLNEMIRNGWAIEDFYSGGLQFDNGECGVALLELYEISGDQNYREAGLKAADWSITRVCVPNWNYNSFSVYLLVKAFQISGDMKYLNAAKLKARLGIYPGQLKAGQYKGRWADGHNARPAYHYIIMRSLVMLVSSLPESDTDYSDAITSLELGMKARNKDFVTIGIVNKNKSLEALLLASERIATSKMASWQVAEAIEALSKRISEEWRRGNKRDQLPLSPGGWGQFLKHRAGAGK